MLIVQNNFSHYVLTKFWSFKKIHGVWEVSFWSIITCVIVRSNLRRLFSFHASSNAGHYQSTMTSHNDRHMWCHERKVCFLLKRQTSVRTTPRTCEFITLRDDCHVWTDQNSLTGIDRHWVKNKCGKVFLHKAKKINSLSQLPARIAFKLRFSA